MAEIDYDALEDALTDQYYSVAFRDLGATLVPGEGQAEPSVFIIGEAPGAQEEIFRKPFIGRSGRVLRDLMLTAHLATTDWQNIADRTYGVANTWLTNVVKFRPPGNRKLSPAEIKAARPYLRTEWTAVGRPRIIIPVGGSALTAVIGKPAGILRHSGWLHEQKSNVDGQSLYVWPMIHPSFALHIPAMRPLLEKDWLKLGEWLNENQGIFTH